MVGTARESLGFAARSIVAVFYKSDVEVGVVDNHDKWS